MIVPSVIDNLMVLARHARFEDPESARRDLMDAVALARKAQTDDPLQLAKTLAALGQIERDLHHADEALRSYEEAASIYRSANDPLKLAHTVRHIGDIHFDNEQLDLAEPYYSEALAMYRTHAETLPLDLANAVRGFALLKEALGETREAIALWEETGRLYASMSIEAGVEESRLKVELLEQKESSEP